MDAFFKSVVTSFLCIIIIMIAISAKRIQDQISNIKPANLTAVYSTITGYSSEEKQTDSTPNITAFNAQVAAGKVAVSRYLFENGWTEGKCVWIDQIGERKIGDIMNRRLRGPRVDIWFHSLKDAEEYGIKPLVLVTLMGCSDF